MIDEMTFKIILKIVPGGKGDQKRINPSWKLKNKKQKQNSKETPQRVITRREN